MKLMSECTYPETVKRFKAEIAQYERLGLYDHANRVSDTLGAFVRKYRSIPAGMTIGEFDAANSYVMVEC